MKRTNKQTNDVNVYWLSLINAVFILFLVQRGGRCRQLVPFTIPCKIPEPAWYDRFVCVVRSNIQQRLLASTCLPYLSCLNFVEWHAVSSRMITGDRNDIRYALTGPFDSSDISLLEHVLLKVLSVDSGICGSWDPRNCTARRIYGFQTPWTLVFTGLRIARKLAFYIEIDWWAFRMKVQGHILHPRIRHSFVRANTKSKHKKYLAYTSSSFHTYEQQEAIFYN